MGFTPEQIKGRIKSVAKQNNADARTLMRIYMMERFLERLARSEYRDNFIIKGGILVTAMIGVAHRSTMDIDTSMKNLNLSAEDALQVVNQVKDIDLDDGVSFEVKDVSNIMDEIYKQIVFSDELKKYLQEVHFYKKPGDHVERFDNAAKCLGIIFMKFPNVATAENILSHMEKHIDVQLTTE